MSEQGEALDLVNANDDNVMFLRSRLPVRSCIIPRAEWAELGFPDRVSVAVSAAEAKADV